MSSCLSKNLFSIIATPIIVAILWALPPLFISLIFHSYYSLYFLGGIILYIIIHFNWHSKTEYLYVLAHEISHAMVGILQGIKVNKISVQKKGGYVVFKGNTNFITELAPYFVPFYAIATAIFYSLLAFFLKVQNYKPLFLLLEGFFIAFHFINTYEILSGPTQSDCKKAGGIFFSYTIIILLNAISLAFILKLLFPQAINISFFLNTVINNFKKIITNISFLFQFIFNTAKI